MAIFGVGSESQDGTLNDDEDHVGDALSHSYGKLAGCLLCDDDGSLKGHSHSS